MKKISVLFVAILTINCLNAQNWNPINKVEKFNYSTSDKLYFTTVWVDSVGYVDSDSVYYFNRIAKFLKKSSGNIAEYWLINQPNYFLSRLRYLSNGDFLFEENDDYKYLIKPHSDLDDNWLLDSTNQVTALVIKIDKRDIFGISDSIKIIELSNNDTIILSKNYGILKFPLFNERKQHIDLIGIEGRNPGIIVPKYSDFFNFNIGDVFCYKLTSRTRWPGPDIWQKITIKDKIIKNESISYRADYKSRTISYEYNNPGDSTFIHIADTVIDFIDSRNFLNNYPNQLLNLSKSGYTLKPLKFSYDKTFQSITKSYEPYPFCQYNGDTIAGYYNPYSCSRILTDSEVYGVNIGLISSEYFEYVDGNPWGISKSKILIGCIVKNKQYGTIVSDQVVTEVAEIGMKSLSSIDFYPNPAKDFITIDNLPQDENCIVTVYNINGVIQFKKTSNESKMLLDLTSMKKGFYFLRISNNKSVEIRTFVVN